jgi:hypothetical protein
LRASPAISDPCIVSRNKKTPGWLISIDIS